MSSTALSKQNSDMGTPGGSTSAREGNRDRRRKNMHPVGNGSAAVASTSTHSVATGEALKEFYTIDFATVPLRILRKYKRIHKLRTKNDYPSREELAAVIQRHFASQSIREIDAVTCFLYSVRHRDSALRLPVLM
ncbi:hypothetical protein BZG36_01031 [Bifiguratus adelaidae]|uniref:Histone deacetylase complex subunit SAP30 Sin3 binding domain-containing protein n=1 Tax=Bifiguratus adelaidae TaxID=1938954 RepID=A0A261Y653_9FUNG|nr:hypothetical protein BZG36_01031 [Bifiguratus adelaidae]